MRCVAPESFATDSSGAMNVRSTPLSLTVDSSEFSLAIVSSLLPLTSNSTIACQLFSTEPLTHIAVEDFVVKNGFLVSLDSVVHIITNVTTGINTYYYDFLIKATVQGQVCVDILKSMDFFWIVKIDTFVGMNSHQQNPIPLSFCITHGRLSARGFDI